jgi:LSD1 subclass zinc finger protein
MTNERVFPAARQPTREKLSGTHYISCNFLTLVNIIKYVICKYMLSYMSGGDAVKCVGVCHVTTFDGACDVRDPRPLTTQ